MVAELPLLDRSMEAWWQTGSGRCGRARRVRRVACRSHATDLGALVQSLAPLLLNGPLASWQPDGLVRCLERERRGLLDLMQL